MISIPALVLCSILLVLSAMHLRWLFGDRSHLSGVVPTRDGELLFEPGRVATFFVAVALLGAAAVSVWRTLDPVIEPAWVPKSAIWVVAGLFALRAVGDFRYIGLFKRVRGTRFARNDSLLFSPLCVVISALAVWLALGY